MVTGTSDIKADPGCSRAMDLDMAANCNPGCVNTMAVDGNTNLEDQHGSGGGAALNPYMATGDSPRH